MSNDTALREHLISLLTQPNAHVTFEKAVKGLAPELRGKLPKGADHTAWELLEHLRIAQWDILDFCANPDYQHLSWPDNYWPATPAPPDDKAWDKSVRAFRRDLKKICALIADENTDLFEPIPHGKGQTTLREALLVADHNAYHIGQLVLVRRLLGAWD
jgi:DinB family protein